MLDNYITIRYLVFGSTFRYQHLHSHQSLQTRTTHQYLSASQIEGPKLGAPTCTEASRSNVKGRTNTGSRGHVENYRFSGRVDPTGNHRQKMFLFITSDYRSCWTFPMVPSPPPKKCFSSGATGRKVSYICIFLEKVTQVQLIKLWRWESRSWTTIIRYNRYWQLK